MKKTSYKTITKSQYQFLQWVYRTQVVDEQSTRCIRPMLNSLKYVSDGECQTCFNELREKYLNEYLKLHERSDNTNKKST